MKIRLVVLDLAGTTIVDGGQVPEAFATALEQFGIQIQSRELEEVRGASKQEVIQTFVGKEKGDVAYKIFQAHLLQRYATSGVEEVAGTTDTLRWLHNRGIWTAIQTGFDRTITRAILQAAGWESNWIDAVVCAEEVPNGRPAPDLIHLAMKKCGVGDPLDVANVGDTALDLRAGASAHVGMNVGVLSGAHGKERLEKEPHTHIIKSVRDLPLIL